MKLYITRDRKWGHLVWGADADPNYGRDNQNDYAYFSDDNCNDRGGDIIADVVDRILPYGPELAVGEKLEIDVTVVQIHKKPEGL